MTIIKGNVVKEIVLYPRAKTKIPTLNHQYPHTYLEENIRSPLTIAEALELKNHTEDDIINSFISLEGI